MVSKKAKCEHPPSRLFTWYACVAANREEKAMASKDKSDRMRADSTTQAKGGEGKWKRMRLSART